MLQLNRRGFLAGLAAAAASLALPFRGLAQPDISKIEMYDLAGQTVFPVYGFSGVISTLMCMFPMIRRGSDMIVFRHDASLLERVSYEPQETKDQFLVRLEREAKEAFARALIVQKDWLELEDGCAFPESGMVAIIRRRKDVQYG